MPANDDLIHGWVSADCGRGTSDILWSCLATIFLCVWTAIHLPVPYYYGQQPLSTRQKLVRSGIGPALISVLVPEFLAVTAISEMTACWLAKEEIHRLTQIDWTLTHQFFLHMGGVCLRSSSGRYSQIGKVEVTGAIKHSPSQSKQRPDPLSWLSELEKLTEDQIKDLAKSDTLSKLIACGQALWLVTQVVTRLCQHRAVTLLEISTCAYVSCALLSYAAWWKKPQGCMSPIMISCPDGTFSELMDPSSGGYYDQNSRREFLWAGRNWVEATDFESGGPQTIVFHLCVSLAVLCPAVFGAVHVASWNFRLPSDVELWMWRGSSLCCLITGTTLGVYMLLSAYDKTPSWLTDFYKKFLLFVGPLYIIVRAYMMVEVFLSLRALPPSAFESVQWSSLIPHV